ncbi:D-3-phosphoglycerate dehydrogenase [Sporobacter termitidis DSM 10068]|uniref:D-3-phosphoglycerate dehydrogenase n=1 Tax=Sporobacter termitidis DSM 10068 TaxID=1123282 RepID=A0A1M5YS04_9FIRM|nr:phosphoglycerate dehydrogenase [Sporobacter termitidis]SHI14618.1 D-3-phosphoglycerate dehydrogenase [Sporobacter termitidis DSM 10068]
MKRIVSFFGDMSDVFVELNERANRYAEGLGYEYKWAPQMPYDRKKVADCLNEADAGIIDVEPYDDDVFSQLNGRTGLLVRFGVGYDKVDLPAASRRGIAVARTTGANTLGVAEMAVTLMLAARRKLKINQKCVDAGVWEKNVAHETIGSTVGIVGFGAIGQKVAELLEGFGCRIVSYDPFAKEELMRRKEIELVSLEELFKISDVITLHVPYSRETHHLADYKLLSRMKETSVIINTSRGNIIDEQALYDVLAAGRIGGAALDVYASEPLPLDSPLLGLDNIILTPHVSSQTVESLWSIYKMAIDIAADFFAGKDSPHILNPDYKTARG